MGCKKKAPEVDYSNVHPGARKRARGQEVKTDFWRTHSFWCLLADIDANILGVLVDEIRTEKLSEYGNIGSECTERATQGKVLPRLDTAHASLLSHSVWRTVVGCYVTVKDRNRAACWHNCPGKRTAKAAFPPLVLSDAASLSLTHKP
jgi:hypothetical protein